MAGYLDPNDPVVQAFAKLGTTPVSDAMDRLGLIGQCFGIKPVDRDFTLCGRAHTVRNEPMTAAHKGESVGDYIDEVAPGGVVVIDNGGRLDATVWGDILTIMADRNNLGGTVIHGVCRDSNRALKLNYPIFSVARTCAPARIASAPTPTRSQCRSARSACFPATCCSATATACSSSRRSTSRKC